MPIVDTMYKNLELGQNFRKISISVKIFRSLDFGQIVEKNLNFCENLQKTRL